MSLNPAERARGPQKYLWARHKDTITDLYKTSSLKEVMKIMEARDFKARLVNRQEVIADHTNSPWVHVHSEQQYKIKLNEWGIHKNKRKGGENRFGRGDQNIGISTLRYDCYTVTKTITSPD